jgi:HAMP domain-containing protein
MTEAQTTASKKLYFSLRLKLLAGFTLIFSLVFAGAFYWFLSFATDQALSRIKQDLLDTLQGASTGVNGEELVALYKDGQPNEVGFSDDPRYISQLDWLQQVHDLEPRAWPYTYVKGEKENEIIYIADLWARYNPDKAALFKDSYISGGSLWRGLSGLSLKDDLNPYTDEYGSWISAYRPVQNAKGEDVGAIGVDFEADYVSEVRQAILDKIALAFGITYVLLFVLVYLVSGALTGPIINLTRAAGRIAEGDYKQDLSHMTKGSFRDEITSMAEVFTIMVGKVYQREQTLIKQVEELKIEIDESKRKKQVMEIVDSEFFQDLQAKSRAMRRRRAEGDDAPSPADEPQSEEKPTTNPAA